MTYGKGYISSQIFKFVMDRMDDKIKLQGYTLPGKETAPS